MAGARHFFFVFKTIRQSLGHIHSPLQLVQQPPHPPPAAIWPGCDADHSPPSNAEVNNEWNHTSVPLYAFMVWTGQLHIFASERSMTYAHKGTSAHMGSGKLRDASLHSVTVWHVHSLLFSRVAWKKYFTKEGTDVLPTTPVPSNFATEHLTSYELA